MLTIGRSLTIAICLVLTLNAHASEANDDVVNLIQLTDKARLDDDLPVEVKRAYAKSESKRQKDSLQYDMSREIVRQRKEMKANGFIVVSDASASSRDTVAAQILAHQMQHNEDYESIASELGYAALDLNQTPFQSGRRLGMMPIRFADDRIHQIVYAYEFDELGEVLVEETSYRTIPEVSISVSEPMGNMRINGYAATYSVTKNHKGDKAMTTIIFFTEEKLFDLTVFNSIMRDDKRFPKLVALAESLQ